MCNAQMKTTYSNTRKSMSQLQARQSSAKFLLLISCLLCLTMHRQALGGPEQISPATIKHRTGIPWQVVRAKTLDSGEFIDQLLRPYPERNPNPDERGIDGSEAVSIVQRFLLQNANLLVADGVPQDLFVKETITNRYPETLAQRGTDYTIVLGHMYQDIPVFESECLISLTRLGEIWSVANRLKTLTDPASVPVLNSSEALQNAKAALNAPGAVSETDPELLVYAPDKFVWRFSFASPVSQDVLVNAVSGEIVLKRSNYAPSAYIDLTMYDRDGVGLPFVPAALFVNDNIVMSSAGDTNGHRVFNSSTVGNTYCRITLHNTIADVQQHIDRASMQLQTESFTTVHGGSYYPVINLNAIDLNNPLELNSAEAGVVWREIQRAWYFIADHYNYLMPGITGVVGITNAGAPAGQSYGFQIEFAPGMATFANGYPSPNARISDFILHEYGHSFHYYLNGGAWNRPVGCACRSHYGENNDCSHDGLKEGWAHYFPVMLYNHIKSDDRHFTWPDGTTGSELDGVPWPGCDERVPMHVASVLFNMFDVTNDSTDPLGGCGWQIFQTIRNHRPQTVEDFFQQYTATYPSEATGLETTFISHSMHPNWLTLSAVSLNFGDTSTLEYFYIGHQDWYGNNNCPVKPTWTIDSDQDWLSVSSETGSTELNALTCITVLVNRESMPDGLHTAHITVTPTYYGRPKQIPVFVQQGQTK